MSGNALNCKLHLTPQYGYGWRTADGGLIEVPTAFSIESTILEAGAPCKGGLERAIETAHPRSGLWIVLWLPTDEQSPSYNLRAFTKEPNEPLNFAVGQPCLTGFATAMSISN
jgi:hypothetical protein